MSVSAFGVMHPEEISKKGNSRTVLRARELTARGLDSLRSATARAAADPKNKDVTLRQAPKVIGEQAAKDSPYGAAFESGQKVAAKVKADPDRAPGVKGAAVSALNNTTIGDLAHGATVKRVDVSPENVLRGQKTTTSYTNVLTGENRKVTRREGNAFFKPKHVVRENGGSEKVVNDEAGGLTGKGKVAFVGGPAAATGLGGLALSEKRKRSYGY